MFSHTYDTCTLVVCDHEYCYFLPRFGLLHNTTHWGKIEGTRSLVLFIFKACQRTHSFSSSPSLFTSSWRATTTVKQIYKSLEIPCCERTGLTRKDEIKLNRMWRSFSSVL